MGSLTAFDYATLAQVVFDPAYPGFDPETKESPNGDGKIDEKKQYAHVGVKNLQAYRDKFPSKTVWARDPEVSEHATKADSLEWYLHAAHKQATACAVDLGLPPHLWPYLPACALRVLRYPPGAGSHKHTDFSLFTLALYRNDVGGVVTPSPPDPDFIAYSGIQIGEQLALHSPKVFTATEHAVGATRRWQYSIVYFALPHPEAKLTDELTAGEFLAERYPRSRVKK